MLTKGLKQGVLFSLVASNRCEGCTCGGVTNALIDVYELSIDRPDYVGLNMTDAMKGKHVKRKASAIIDPDAAMASYEWLDCGKCEFTGEKNGKTVTYGATNKTEPSVAFLAESLTVSATVENADGVSDSSNCTTNFTIVKVDVTIGGVGEEKEETEGAFLPYVADKDGKISEAGGEKMLAVSFSCKPRLLQSDESVTVTHSGAGELYEKLSDGTLVLVEEKDYPAAEIDDCVFLLHGHGLSWDMRDGEIMIVHKNSGAVDLANYSVYNIRLVTPAGDPVSGPVDSGDGQNEFTYSGGDPGVLTMNLKAVASPKGMALRVKDQCAFTVGAIGDSKMAWGEGNPGGVPAVDGDSLVAKVTFTGLPKHNSDFGKKVASISVDGIRVDSSEYEVFFNASAANHPACHGGDGCGSCPNWFFYWKEGEVCSIPQNAVYDPSSRDNYSFDGRTDFANLRIILGPSAPECSYAKNVIGIFFSEKEDDNGIATVVKQDVFAQVGADSWGVRAVAATVKHELKHMEIHKSYVGSDKYIPPVTIEIEGEIINIGGDDGYDSDSDFVADEDESGGKWGLKTMVGNPDTYGLATAYSSVYHGYGDNEVQARNAEAVNLEDGVAYFTTRDWANPGCQSKKTRGPLPPSR